MSPYPLAVTPQPVGDLRTGSPTDSQWWVSPLDCGGWCPPRMPCGVCPWLAYLVSPIWCCASLLLRALADESLITHPNRYVSSYWLCHEGNCLLHLPWLLQEGLRREMATPPPSATAHKEQGCPDPAEHLTARSDCLSALLCPTPSQWSVPRTLECFSSFC